MPREDLDSATYDFIGIGVGPFNLGLACLTDPIEDLTGLFLDTKPHFEWHPGMLLDGSTVQTPFLADLVTMADPTSRFSFLNYLKASGRLYAFYIRENFHPLRTEYSDYCRWAAEQLPNILFGHHVTEVEYLPGDRVYRVHATNLATGQRVQYKAKRLVLGVGTRPHIPVACGSDSVLHTSSYLQDKNWLQQRRSIAVIGSGQSAAEVFSDLLQDIDEYGYALTWITRSARFFPLEYTKLTLEMTSPEYVHYFHALPGAKRDALVASQKNLYKGIDSSLIDGIFDQLYTKTVKQPCNVRMLTNTALTGVNVDASGEHVLNLHHEESDRYFTLSADGVVFGTGYRYDIPEFLSPLSDRIRWDEHGRFHVANNYSIDAHGQEIFVQNAELHTHGFVAPDLGMGAYRNSCIIRELLGREYYPIEKTTVFQDFLPPSTPDPMAEGSRR